MSERLRIASISELHQVLGVGEPVHPLVTVIDYASLEAVAEVADREMICDLYVASLKLGAGGSLEYGRGTYDFAEGSMLFLAPGQVFRPPPGSADDPPRGYGVFVHPDFLPGTQLGESMRGYSYFGYDVAEALHLSRDERDTVESLIELVAGECGRVSQLHNREVLSASLALLLEHAQRFYARQFETRRGHSRDVVAEFERSLADYFDDVGAPPDKLPDVAHFAAGSGLSPRYFADLIKRYTGRTVLEHVHGHIIALAKHRLLVSEQTVAEVAYSLGYEYPQYFSRLFRARVGVSPGAWRRGGRQGA